MKTALGMLRKFFPEVSVVKDATEPIEVAVTTADHASAEPLRADRCVVAQACQRQFQLDGALVSTAIAYFVKGRVATRYRVPERVAREIAIFDRAGSVAPGTYRFIPPETGQGLGSHAKKSRHRRPNQGTPAAPRVSTFGIRARLAAAVCECGNAKLAAATECYECRRRDRVARNLLRVS